MTVCWIFSLIIVNKFLQTFSGADQRNLLLANTDMLVNIKSARMLKPGVNLQDQVSSILILAISVPGGGVF